MRSGHGNDTHGKEPFVPFKLTNVFDRPISAICGVSTATLIRSLASRAFSEQARLDNILYYSSDLQQGFATTPRDLHRPEQSGLTSSVLATVGSQASRQEERWKVNVLMEKLLMIPTQ